METNPFYSNHMPINWHDYAYQHRSVPIGEAPLRAKASVIGRIGLMLLACGTGAWRVRRSMNTVARALHLTCTADIGLTSISYTCFDHDESFSQTLGLKEAGVNTAKLNELENFVETFPGEADEISGEAIHKELDAIDRENGPYTPLQLGAASALACGAFTFLLGGGPIEIFCAFLGAGAGNYLRAQLLRRRYTLFLCIVLSVMLACLVYTLALRVGETMFSVSSAHEAGYICAMLFIIPGFPFITSGIDLAKQDMRSGLERLAYALIIIAVATLTAWIMAMLLGLNPGDFPEQNLSDTALLFFRLLASFCGVFGFSIMFNSPVRLAASAALIGMIANTLRLELVDYASMAPAAAAFLGALTAGLLASLLKDKLGYTRISVTVPSIVIMVPGLYLYRGVYLMGIMDLTQAAPWLASATLIVLALPLGLIFARILTDRDFRHCS